MRPAAAVSTVRKRPKEQADFAMPQPTGTIEFYTGRPNGTIWRGNENLDDSPLPPTLFAAAAGTAANTAQIEGLIFVDAGQFGP